VIDDLIVYFFDEAHFRLVVNAATRAKDLAWIEKQAAAFGVEVRERPEFAMIAVQGPNARAKVLGLLHEVDRTRIEKLGKFAAAAAQGPHGMPLFVARTGYTGEDGFEIIVPAEHAVALWEALAAAGVAPAGLGARDTLRLEAGLCLHGHDIDAGTTPVEAGLTWAIQKVRRPGGTREGRYPGAPVIEAQLATGPISKRTGLVGLERVPVREGAPVLDHHGRKLGRVTSGTIGPTVNKPIAMAYLAANHAIVGHEVHAEVRGALQPMRVTAMPFVPHRYVRG